MARNVIETRGLTVTYGRHRGIVDVDLAVHEGEIFGFLGPNGAGKTTTQRVLLDIIRPTRGEACIFGLDCQQEGATIRQQVGYLPGELSLYPNMRGGEFLALIASLRDGDEHGAYRHELCRRFDLDTGRRVSQYSRGNKQKLGLVAAFMSKPALLILDEPTSGLDPLVQQTVLDLVRETRQEGRTVFFSSHILSEVQAVCDRVGIIREGRLIEVQRVEDLIHQNLRRLRLRLRETPPDDAFAFSGVREVSRHDGMVELEVQENLQAVMESAVRCGVLDLETSPVTLEEIFLAYYGADEGADGGHHA